MSVLVEARQDEETFLAQLVLEMLAGYTPRLTWVIKCKVEGVVMSDTGECPNLIAHANRRHPFSAMRITHAAVLSELQSHQTGHEKH